MRRPASESRSFPDRRESPIDRSAIARLRIIPRALCYSSIMSSAVSTQAAHPIELADAVTMLASHGYRLTGPRKSVLAAVLDKDRPFTAEQLVAELPGIGRATVYRTLEILASVDLLTRLLQPGGHPAYVVGAPGHVQDARITPAPTFAPIPSSPVIDTSSQ